MNYAILTSMVHIVNHANPNNYGSRYEPY